MLALLVVQVEIMRVVDLCENNNNEQEQELDSVAFWVMVMRDLGLATCTWFCAHYVLSCSLHR